MRFVSQIMDWSGGGVALSFYVCVLRPFILEVLSIFIYRYYGEKLTIQRIPRAEIKWKPRRRNIRPPARRGKGSLRRGNCHWADERKRRWDRQQLCQDRHLGRGLEEIARVHGFIKNHNIWSIYTSLSIKIRFLLYSLVSASQSLSFINALKRWEILFCFFFFLCISRVLPTGTGNIYLFCFVHLGICLALIFKNRIPAYSRVDSSDRYIQLKWEGGKHTELGWTTRSNDFALGKRMLINLIDRYVWVSMNSPKSSPGKE